MTPEQKLEHLKDWINLRIEAMVFDTNAISAKDILRTFLQTGILISRKATRNTVPSFETYLKQL